MATSTKKVKAVAKISYSSCTLFCSEPMICPLCRVTVPPWTKHECKKESK